MARTITRFGALPVTMKPPIPTLSPVWTNMRVDRLTVCAAAVGDGVGVPGVAVRVGLGVGVCGVGVGLGVGVCGVGVGLGVGVPGVGLGLGQTPGTNRSVVFSRVVPEVS